MPSATIGAVLPAAIPRSCCLPAGTFAVLDLTLASGRERVNLNAALNAYAPTQVLLDKTGGVNAQSMKYLYEQRPPTPTRPVAMSCATMPVTTKTRSCGPG